jgi:pilus assembly protein CpaF
MADERDPWHTSFAQGNSGDERRRALEYALAVHRELIGTKEVPELREATGTDLERFINEAIGKLSEENDWRVTAHLRSSIIQLAVSELRGYGPLDPLLKEDAISEIMVNGPNTVYVERAGMIERSPVIFYDDDHVLRITDRIISPLGRRVDEASPMVDARLPDGSRVNAIIPPVALNGPCLTIRKFARDPFKAEDLVGFGTMTQEMSDFLRACVQAELNILVSGGTGSGKTTTLNVLSSFIPNSERIVTIEDAAELQLQQEHVVTLESRPANLEGRGEVPIRQLVRNSLRMRPDRIVVGEVRGSEALDMLQAMNTGHEGSMSTLHANAPRDALTRLETMVLMAGTELPSRAIREQIVSALDLIVHQSRLRDGSRRVVSITEVQRLEGDVITMQEIYTFNQHGVDGEGRVVGEHAYTGLSPLFLDRILALGVELPTGFKQRRAA